MSLDASMYHYTTFRYVNSVRMLFGSYVKSDDRKIGAKAQSGDEDIMPAKESANSENKRNRRQCCFRAPLIIARSLLCSLGLPRHFVDVGLDFEPATEIASSLTNDSEKKARLCRYGGLFSGAAQFVTDPNLSQWVDYLLPPSYLNFGLHQEDKFECK
ncbi:hypothetical protein PoB_003743200 [Plakobranchus ocellatus]|uniref:Uncharacterized protein n=1 Tax=Plakobranchus ocellatus TaxID=259542 RepID=A0AAV4AUD2_9GAST|nr:hypothetical protein PoB_003743200 [Plakobranchus ocellatus]